MQMILYHTDDQPNVINKKLLELRTVNIILREMVDEKAPVLLLHDDTIANANYCYLPTFKRYYFIEQVMRYNAHLVKVLLTSDLLMTYQDTLLNSEVKITATEKPSYLSTNLPTTTQNTVRKTFSTVTLPTVNSIILTTVGGINNGK